MQYPDARLDYFTDRRGLLLRADQVWDCIRTAAQRAFPHSGQSWAGLRPLLDPDPDQPDEP